MPRSVASTSRSGRDTVVYTNRVARTDTTAKDLFKLKAGDIPMSLSLYNPTLNNAGTSAMLSIGSTGNATYFTPKIELKGGTYGQAGQSTPSTVTNLMEPLPFDTMVTGTYSEVGTASTAGGPYTVVMTVLKS